MEVFLILIVLILVFIIYSRNNAYHKDIKNSVDDLHQKINVLYKELSSLQNTDVKPKESVKPIPKVEPEVIKPVEIKPPTPQPAIIADTVSKPIPIKPVVSEPVKPKEPAIPKKSWFE